MAYEEYFGYWQYDLKVDFVQPLRHARIRQSLQQFSCGAEMPADLIEIEYWNVTNATFVDAPGRDGHNFPLLSLPPNSTMIRPSLVAGRWLLPTDHNAVVVDLDILESEPAIR